MISISDKKEFARLIEKVVHHFNLAKDVSVVVSNSFETRLEYICTGSHLHCLFRWPITEQNII